MAENDIVQINEELCTGCGDCVNMCPMGILYIDEETNLCKVTDHQKCDLRRGCESACPYEAIKIRTQ